MASGAYHTASGSRSCKATRFCASSRSIHRSPGWTSTPTTRRGIVGRSAAINGIGIIEPQIVGAQVVERGSIFAAASGDGGLRILAKAHLAVNIGGKRTKLNGRGRRAAKNCDDQGAQTGAHLYTNCATTGVNNIVKMGRKKNMAVVPLDIVKTIELQRCAPSINLWQA